MKNRYTVEELYARHPKAAEWRLRILKDKTLVRTEEFNRFACSPEGAAFLRDPDWRNVIVRRSLWSRLRSAWRAFKAGS